MAVLGINVFTFYGVKRPGALAADDGFLVDTGSVAKESGTASSLFGSTATDTVGVKATRKMLWRLPVPFDSAALRVWLRLEWEIASASAGTPQGRINLDARRNAAAIGGLTKTSGPARSMSAANGTRFVELLALDIPDTTWGATDTLELLFELEVTVASGSGGSTGSYQINHDPATAGRELEVTIHV